MTENEIVIFEIPDHIYDGIINDCVKYAFISLPFTVDRMNLVQKHGIEQGTALRIYNIVKGKIAEALFAVFSEANSLNLDFNSCSTPFYQIDKRDFLYNNKEFDIKNNFIYHSGQLYDHYISLPALIPNRFQGDQWDSRLKPYLKNEVAYIFSFLKGAELNNGKRRQEFLQLNISSQQSKFLQDLYLKFEGKPQKHSPFDEAWFWKQIADKGTMDLSKLHFRPKLILAGAAEKDNWYLMKDVGPFSPDHYRYEPVSNWYQKAGENNTLKFLNGAIWSTIKNKCMPVQYLTPISDIFPQLRTQITFGRSKDQNGF